MEFVIFSDEILLGNKIWSNYEEPRSQCMFIWPDRPSIVLREERSRGNEFEI